MFVKICGLSTAVDVAAAVAAGADALGFVLTESPRRVEPGLVRELVAAVPEEVLTVAVFREELTAYVREAVRAAGVRAVQLHGSHPAGAFAELSDLGLPLVRATSAAKAAGADCGDFGEDLLLLDAPVPGAGEPWDWAELGARPCGREVAAGGRSRPGERPCGHRGREPVGRGRLQRGRGPARGQGPRPDRRVRPRRQVPLTLLGPRPARGGTDGARAPGRSGGTRRSGPAAPLPGVPGLPALLVVPGLLGRPGPLARQTGAFVL